MSSIFFNSVSRLPTISFAVKVFHYCFSVPVAASSPHHPPIVLGQNSLEKLTRCFSVIFPFTMQNIKLPQTSDHPIQSNGWWLTTWYRCQYTDRETSKNSPASEKMLNYVCELLRNIVGGLNNNFSKLSDGLKEIRSEIQGAHSKIADDRKKDEERHDQLLSRIEATNGKVDCLQDTLKHNEQKMDKIIQQLSAWTTSSSIQFEQNKLSIRAPPSGQAIMEFDGHQA
jgi:chaperonin cofactor prefoldin